MKKLKLFSIGLLIVIIGFGIICIVLGDTLNMIRGVTMLISGISLFVATILDRAYIFKVITLITILILSILGLICIVDLVFSQGAIGTFIMKIISMSDILEIIYYSITQLPIIAILELIPLIYVFLSIRKKQANLNNEDASTMDEKVETNIEKTKGKKIKSIVKFVAIIIINISLFMYIFYGIILPAYYRPSIGIAYKPIIYLYPETETEVTVKLGKYNNITCIYPEYNDGWNVCAQPDGNLIDLNTGRNLYSLYWEGINDVKCNYDSGFVVKGCDTIKFLEEKLSILGLTDREAEEFIIYWLPKMQNNKYNYIRFATMDEINEIMPLYFSVEPDTLIRVLMEFKPLKEYIDIPEQELITPIRKGFVVVEWGGTELK